MMIHLYGMEYLPTYVYTFASIILQFSTHIIDTRDFLYLISFPYITSLLYLGSKQCATYNFIMYVLNCLCRMTLKASLRVEYFGWLTDVYSSM